MQCAYKGCKENQMADGQILSFHGFPCNDIERCREWVRRCGKEETENWNIQKLCSNHFLNSDYVSGTKAKFMRLKETALPLDHQHNGNVESSSHSQSRKFDCSTSEKFTTHRTSLRQNDKEKIKAHEKIIEHRESINSPTTSSFVSKKSKQFHRDQINFTFGRLFSQEEFDEQQSSTSNSKMDENFRSQDEKKSTRQHKKPGSKIMERLQILIEDAARENLKAQDTCSFTDEEVYKFKEKMKAKVLVLLEKNSEIKQKLEAAEEKNRQFSEILRNQEAEMMKVKSSMTVQSRSNGDQSDCVSDLQKKLKLITQQRDLYRQQLNEYVTKMDIVHALENTS